MNKKHFFFKLVTISTSSILYPSFIEAIKKRDSLSNKTNLEKHCSVEVLGAVLDGGVASGRDDVAHGRGTIPHNRVHWQGYAVWLFRTLLGLLIRHGLYRIADGNRRTRRGGQVRGHALHAAQLACVWVLRKSNKISVKNTSRFGDLQGDMRSKSVVRFYIHW